MLFKQLWRYSKGSRLLVSFFIALSLLANGLLLLEPVIVGRIFNSVQFSAADPRLITHILHNLGWLLALTLGFWVFHGTSRILERKHAFSVRQNYKQALLGLVLDLPAGWHKNHHSGDTIDKINKASESLYTFAGSTYTLNQNLVRLVGSLVILTFFDWRVSLIALTASLVAIYSMIKFDAALSRYYAAIFRSENRLAAAVHDYISNILTIITLKLKPRVMREIDDRSRAGLPHYKKSLVIAELKWFWVNFLISLMIVSVLATVAYTSYRTSGVVVIGTLFTLYRYLQSLGDVFSSFASRYGEFVQQEAAVLAAETISQSHSNAEQANSLKLPDNWQNLEIKNLAFTYEMKEATRKKANDLSGVNLKIQRGQKIAFVGESGSGKSTTLGLLRGLYHPRSGELLCDGQQLPRNLDALHNAVLLIPQEPELFNSTIRDNITMDLAASEEELAEIIDMAQLRGLVDRLPKGLETFVKEKGVSMSGGEKQRVALARGLLATKLSLSRRSDIVLLDEPTSNVDASNELQIYLNVFAAFKRQTVVSTIHRLHLLPLFDYIYLFQNGTVVAEGTLTDIKQYPGFRELWDNYHHVSRLLDERTKGQRPQSHPAPASA